MKRHAALIPLALLLTACSSTPPPTPEARQERAKPPYLVYITNENGGDVSVIDPVALDVVATIPVGKRPRGIHASPDHKLIYVALSGSPPAPPGVDESTLPPPDKTADGIGVIDAASGKVIRVIKSGSDPEEFDLSPDGAQLYVSNEDAALASIVDVASGAITQTFTVGEEPEGVTRSPNGAFFYVTSEQTGTIAVIDPKANKLLKTIKAGRRPRSVAFLPDSKRAYVTNENDGFLTVIDSTRHVVTGKIVLGEPGVIKPMRVIVSPGGETAYVSTGRGKKVFIIDTRTNTVTASMEAGQRPWGIALAPDGKLLFAADGPSNSVAVIDLAQKKVVKSIPAGRGPWGALAIPQ